MSDLNQLIAAFGVRETLVSLVVLVAVYMLVVVLRMKRLSAPPKTETLSSARYEADLSGRNVDLDRFYLSPERTQSTASVTLEDDWREPPAREGRDGRDARGPGAQVTSFDQEKLIRLERDLAATRFELDALRSSFAEVRDELRQEVERLKATQRVSPLYADSMQMAIAGASAEDIVSRCGIARAEADLVLALSQGRGENQGTRGKPDPKPSPEAGQSRYGSF